MTLPLRPPPVEILKVAHHGSADDGLPDLLARRAPARRRHLGRERKRLRPSDAVDACALSRTRRPSTCTEPTRTGAVVSSRTAGASPSGRSADYARSVSGEPLQPGYLLLGSDRPKIRRALSRLRARFAAESVELLDADAATGADAVAACNALGLFGDDGRAARRRRGRRALAGRRRRGGRRRTSPIPAAASVARARRRGRAQARGARRRVRAGGQGPPLRRAEAARPLGVGARGVRAARRPRRRGRGARARRDRRATTSSSSRARSRRSPRGPAASRSAAARSSCSPCAAGETFVWALTDAWGARNATARPRGVRDAARARGRRSRSRSRPRSRGYVGQRPRRAGARGGGPRRGRDRQAAEDQGLPGAQGASTTRRTTRADELDLARRPPGRARRGAQGREPSRGRARARAGARRADGERRDRRRTPSRASAGAARPRGRRRGRAACDFLRAALFGWIAPRDGRLDRASGRAPRARRRCAPSSPSATALLEALEERLRGRAPADVLLPLAGGASDTAFLLLDVRHERRRGVPRPADGTSAPDRSFAPRRDTGYPRGPPASVAPRVSSLRRNSTHGWCAKSCRPLPRDRAGESAGTRRGSGRRLPYDPRHAAHADDAPPPAPTRTSRAGDSRRRRRQPSPPARRPPRALDGDLLHRDRRLADPRPRPRDRRAPLLRRRGLDQHLHGRVPDPEPRCASLVADAALSAAFVPVFSELLEKREKARAPGASPRRSSGSSSSASAALTALFILLAPWLMKPFGYEGAQEELVVDLSRVLFPTVVLLGLSGIVVGILNSYDHFTVPALAPGRLEPRDHPRPRPRRPAARTARSAQLYVYAGVDRRRARVSSSCSRSPGCAGSTTPPGGDRLARPGRSGASSC